MSGWSFRRTLSKEMLDVNNEGYSSGSWIKQYMDDSEVLLAIRDGSLNFYFRGNSILQLLYKNGILDGKVHYKYPRIQLVSATLMRV